MKNITFDHPTQSADLVKGKPHVHVFKGYNLTNKTLTKNAQSSSCSCTHAEVPNTVGPFEEFEIKMTVNKESTGLFSVYLSVEYDKEAHLLRLNGNVH